MIDDHDLDRPFVRIQLQPKLFAEGGEDVGTIRGRQVSRSVWSAGQAGRRLGGPLQLEIIELSEARLIDYRPVQPLRKKPRKIRHGTMRGLQLPKARPCDGNIEMLRGVILRQFRSGPIDNQLVSGKRTHLFVELQLKTIDQQILKHDVQLIDRVWAIRFGFDIVRIGFDPTWTAGYLSIAEVEHQLDHQLYRHVGCGVALTSGQRLDDSSIGVRVRGFDRRHLKLESRRRTRLELAESTCRNQSKNRYEHCGMFHCDHDARYLLGMSILRRLLCVINDVNLYWTFLRFQFQAELFLERGKQRRP